MSVQGSSNTRTGVVCKGDSTGVHQLGLLGRGKSDAGGGKGSGSGSESKWEGESIRRADWGDIQPGQAGRHLIVG